MSFNFRLQNLDSSGGVGAGNRRLGGAGRPRRRPRSAAPFLEQLETRITLSVSTLASFAAPAGLAPRGAVIMDSSGNLYGTTPSGGASGDGTVFELAPGGSVPTALATFNGANGARPLAGLLIDGSGNLYGTTSSGGAGGGPGFGTVFELAHGSGRITTLASFDSIHGGNPEGAVIMDSSGNLYGTTYAGGAAGEGTLFEVPNGSGTIVSLASFNYANGEYPSGGLIIDSTGNLYGTASLGGSSSVGTVFELVHGSGTITALASFNRTTGEYPYGGVIMDNSGNLYGTTEWGISSSDGTVFELAHGSGTITPLASFNGTNGSKPYAPLIMDSGNLYGTTDAGGASGLGTVFELAQGSSTITALASFNGYVGHYGPRPGLFKSGGNLYGTTEGAGVSNNGGIFELAQGSGTITTLASFNVTEGAKPSASVIMDSSGNLYGTASNGGASSAGTVFELVHGTNTITTLASFNGANGLNPLGTLFMDSSGNLYGTTQGGGAAGDGTVFELAQGSGTITMLASFNGSNGLHPEGSVIFDSAGNLYGTTNAGGVSSDGTVFELAKGSATITTLASFSGINGTTPNGDLIMDSAGNLYGTTGAGGASGEGTVFELAHGGGTISTLATFSGTNGSGPNGGLLMDSSGNLYGVTYQGGSLGYGTIFELAQGRGAIITLGSFNGADGTYAGASLVMDRGGNLYGEAGAGGASGYGTVFELAHGSGTITAVVSFSGGTDGKSPIGGLIVDKSGNLYGTTSAGGAGGLPGFGTIFELANPGTTFAVGGFPSPAIAGAAGSLTVTARNGDGTTDTAYTGTVHFASSDRQAVLPAEYTFSAADAGAHTFSATLKSAGTQSFTATDTVSGLIFASQTGIVVKPAAASQLIIGGLPGVKHGVAFTFTISMVDAYGNVATGYVGTVHFRSSDSTATLPANYIFTAADAGQHTFVNQTILRKKGKQTLTLIDTLNSALSDTESVNVA